jgi:hypothetical protein
MTLSTYIICAMEIPQEKPFVKLMYTNKKDGKK